MQIDIIDIIRDLEGRGEIYKTVYGVSETCSEEKKLDVAEMRISRWMCGLWSHKVVQNIRNKRIRGIREMGEICKQVQERNSVTRRQ